MYTLAIRISKNADLLHDKIDPTIYCENSSLLHLFVSAVEKVLYIWQYLILIIIKQVLWL